MKQYIHCKSKPVRYIDIIIVMDSCNMQNMCAQSKVKHPENIPEDEKWSDTQLAFYNDFLDSVENSIQKYFIIDNQNQSVSYSYYFEFHTNIENWVLRVRISDHVIPHTRNKPDFNKTIILKSYLGKLLLIQIKNLHLILKQLMQLMKYVKVYMKEIWISYLNHGNLTNNFVNKSVVYGLKHTIYW